LAGLQDRSSCVSRGSHHERTPRATSLFPAEYGPGKWSLPVGRYCHHPNMRNARMRQKPIAVIRNLAGLVLAGTTVAAIPTPRDNPAAVSARLSEWTIKLSETTIPAGRVRFTVTNGGSIP